MTDDPPTPLCADHPDPDLWFSTQKARIRAAQAICKVCPLLKECHALVTDLEAGSHSTRRFGVWAATLPLHRAKADSRS